MKPFALLLLASVLLTGCSRGEGRDQNIQDDIPTPSGSASPYDLTTSSPSP